MPPEPPATDADAVPARSAGADDRLVDALLAEYADRGTGPDRAFVDRVMRGVDGHLAGTDAPANAAVPAAFWRRVVEDAVACALVVLAVLMLTPLAGPLPLAAVALGFLAIGSAGWIGAGDLPPLWRWREAWIRRGLGALLVLVGMAALEGGLV